MKSRGSGKGRIRLRELGEDKMLSRVLPFLSRGRKDVLAGAGDDCAVVRVPGENDLLLLKTDCVVENIHFKSSDDAGAIGWKAMMRPLSDFAAMSGIPRFALITLIVSGERSFEWIKKLYRGLRRAASRFDIDIVGGETSDIRGPTAIAVSVAGFVERNRVAYRHGGKMGDDLFVTGSLGGSGRGKHLRFLPRIAESRWLSRTLSIHAMIDLSDGIGADLPRLAKASGVGFELDPAQLPLTRGATVQSALSDGEDYELLFAVSRQQRGRLQKAWRRKFARLPLTRIGSLTRKPKIETRELPGGYLHFQ